MPTLTPKPNVRMHVCTRYMNVIVLACSWSGRKWNVNTLHVCNTEPRKEGRNVHALQCDTYMYSPIIHNLPSDHQPTLAAFCHLVCRTLVFATRCLLGLDQLDQRILRVVLVTCLLDGILVEPAWRYLIDRYVTRYDMWRIYWLDNYWLDIID